MILDRVIVGVDGSDGGWAALAEALRLHELGGELRAVTVCEEGWAALAGPLAPRCADEIRSEAESAHGRAAWLLVDEPRASAELVVGRAAGALLALARRWPATLVVVGGGRTAAAVVRGAPCSTLVVAPQRRRTGITAPSTTRTAAP